MRLVPHVQLMLTHICTRVMAGAPGLEPGPSVLETDMLAINTMPPERAVSNRLPDASKKLEMCLILLPGEERVSGRNGNTSSAPICQDRFSCSSWSNSYAVYSPYRLKI